MHRVFWVVCFVIVMAVPAVAGHFFLPSRSFFYYRPDNFLYNQYGAYCGYSHFSYRQPSVAVTPLLRPRYRVRRPLARAVVGSKGVRIIPTTSQVIFEVVPPSALVYVDGRLMGSARSFTNEETACPLNEGIHVLRLEASGYQSYEADIATIPGRTVRLDITLEREQADGATQETAGVF